MGKKKRADSSAQSLLSHLTTFPPLFLALLFSPFSPLPFSLQQNKFILAEAPLSRDILNHERLYRTRTSVLQARKNNKHFTSILDSVKAEAMERHKKQEEKLKQQQQHQQHHEAQKRKATQSYDRYQEVQEDRFWKERLKGNGTLLSSPPSFFSLFVCPVAFLCFSLTLSFYFLPDSFLFSLFLLFFSFLFLLFSLSLSLPQNLRSFRLIHVVPLLVVFLTPHSCSNSHSSHSNHSNIQPNHPLLALPPLPHLLPSLPLPLLTALLPPPLPPPKRPPSLVR